MKTISSKSQQDSSFSLSRRYFNWKKKVREDDMDDEDEEDDEEHILTKTLERSSSYHSDSELSNKTRSDPDPKTKTHKLSKLKHAFSVFNRSTKTTSFYSHTCLGTRVVGTLYGHRRGRVHFAVQSDPTRLPAVVIEFQTPTSVLIGEMGSGVVRIALECERNRVETESKKKKKLLEESTWRAYCNGKKCGFAVRRDYGPNEWAVLRGVGPITMGAGVIPAAVGNGAAGSELGELMYMRARFERVVGSRDSEAYYMMNPGGSRCGPELSVYFLRV